MGISANSGIYKRSLVGTVVAPPTGVDRVSPNPVPEGRSIMRQLRTGDPWIDAHQMRPEELLAEARVFAAQRAILRGASRPPRAERGWAALTLAPIGRWLVGLVARFTAS